jgi:chromosome partitioning protein
MFAETLEKECGAGHDTILIDVAGTADRIMLLAASAADLIITPARLSEPDIRQASRLIVEVETMTRRFQQQIPHRLLVNDVDPLDPHYQRHTLAELERLGLPRFETLIYKRAAYREAFLTGKPPHYADKTRQAVKKTILEVDALLDEVIALLEPVSMKAVVNG